jgi:hypothetical protein
MREARCVPLARRACTARTCAVRGVAGVVGAFAVSLGGPTGHLGPLNFLQRLF